MKKIILILLPLCLLFTIMISFRTNAASYSGYCGDNTTYSFDMVSGTLTISGRGAIDSCSKNHLGYWHNTNIPCNLISSVVINEGVTSIGDQVFYRCNYIRNVSLPSTLASIGKYAFGNCQVLSKISFPESIQEISSNAFSGCKELKTIEINNIASWCKAKIDLSGSPAYSSEGNLYINGSSATRLEIPVGVTSIENDTFYGFSNITEIIIPEGVRTIGVRAFCSIKSLKSVTLPNTLTSIGFSAFNSCPNLASIKIPESVIFIDENAFGYNQNKSHLYVYEGSVGHTYAVENSYSYTLIKSFKNISFNSSSYYYDGTQKELKISGTLPNGANVAYTNNKGTVPGTYKATAIITANGYEPLELTATLTINKRPLTITGLVASNKIYDGTNEAMLSGGSLSGLISGDDINVLIPQKGTFAKSSIGNDIAVAIDNITISGADKDNYVFTQPQGLRANIIARPITITAKSYIVKQNDNIPELEYEITSGSLAEGDSITGKLSTNANSSVLKNYDITQGTLALNSNYNVTFVKGTISIVSKTPQGITVESINSKTYGDDPFELNVTDNNAELGAIIFHSSNPNVATVDADGNVTIKGAGSTTLTVSRDGNDDYANFEKALTLTVSKKSVTIKADDKSKKIGNDDPELTYQLIGELVDGDSVTGALTRRSGERIGRYDILIGSLAINNNYSITYQKGILEIVDKNPQSITVASITSKSYGDDPFELNVTDNNAELGAIIFHSSNPNVATVDAHGIVTIKGAGSTTLTVSRDGNDDYASFEKALTLSVSKKSVTIKADDKSKKIGNDDPELTYQLIGELVDGDSVTGALTRRSGERIGRYDILIGSLTINNNYSITYQKGVLEIVDKTPQEIIVSEITSKTYGDSSFDINVTPDYTSQLTDFTFESSNTAVADISASGKITIKSAGSTDITVKQAGNDEYAAFFKTQTLVVNQKSVSVESINAVEKTSVTTGILITDAEVTIDFNNLKFEVIGTISDTMSSVKFSNIKLIGEKSENYKLANETIKGSIPSNSIVSVTIISESGIVNGGGKYIKGSTVTVTAENNGKYRFDGWYIGEECVSTNNAYTFTINSDTTLTAEFIKKNSSTTVPITTQTHTVKYQTYGGSVIKQNTFKDGEVITKPATPIKEGYKFDGWYTDISLTKPYIFGEKVTKSFTLYAKWIKLSVWNNSFKDVTENDWFYESVKAAFENKLMSGISESEFAPNEKVTRGMLVTVLYRNEGQPTVNRSIPFEDVDMSAYYADAVIWAKQNGIVNGVTETKFAPNINVTREQIATIIYRYAKYKGYNVDSVDSASLNAYADANKISEYALSPMCYMVTNKLINGKTTTTLNSGETATRAEIATILQRFMEINK